MKRNSNAAYLGYGLLVGAGIGALGIVAVAALGGSEITQTLLAAETPVTAEAAPPPTNTPPPLAAEAPALEEPPAPTFTFTPTPTYIAANHPVEATLLPSPTPGRVEQMLANGEMAFAGPLAPEQQIRLYEAAIQLIAPSPGESERIGEQIAGAGYGSPTLICGPLSFYILQSAGLMENSDLKPLDFWLLNPYASKDRAILRNAFPPQKYERHDIPISLREVTFSTYPLYPGDFLYIRHGSGGNFDHMLVVTRVDALGRAYSVTNYNAGTGFIINEVMLYDPNDKNAGIFMQWTAKRKAVEGATGFGGFEFWRLRSSP